MPYIITTIAYDTPRSRPSTTRRAVATLDEATSYAADIVDAGPPITNRAQWLSICEQGENMPESGGTVGPLTDGTIIEVERVSWGQLRYASVGRGAPLSDDLIEDYNAAQHEHEAAEWEATDRYGSASR